MLTPCSLLLLFEVKALTLFVTHYPPLCELERVYPEHVGNYHMAFLLNEPDITSDSDGKHVCVFVHRWKYFVLSGGSPKCCIVLLCKSLSVSNFDNINILTDEGVRPEFITFLYQLTDGAAGRSYGLNVARLADIPDPILHTATRKARELERAVNARRYGEHNYWAWVFFKGGTLSGILGLKINLLIMGSKAWHVKTFV